MPPQRAERLRPPRTLDQLLRRHDPRGQTVPATVSPGAVAMPDVTPHSALLAGSGPRRCQPTGALRPRVARSSEHGGHGQSSSAGMKEGAEYATFPPLSGDRHPSANHPLPDLVPHPRIPARHHQRGPDRALLPGPSRSSRRPRHVSSQGSARQPGIRPDVRQPRAQFAAPSRASDHRA